MRIPSGSWPPVYHSICSGGPHLRASRPGDPAAPVRRRRRRTCAAQPAAAPSGPGSRYPVAPSTRRDRAGRPAASPKAGPRAPCRRRGFYRYGTAADYRQSAGCHRRVRHYPQQLIVRPADIHRASARRRSPDARAARPDPTAPARRHTLAFSRRQIPGGLMAPGTASQAGHRAGKVLWCVRRGDLRSGSLRTPTRRAKQRGGRWPPARLVAPPQERTADAAVERVVCGRQCRHVEY
jgi:hypothetical protein